MHRIITRTLPYHAPEQIAIAIRQNWRIEFMHMWLDQAIGLQDQRHSVRKEPFIARQECL